MKRLLFLFIFSPIFNAYGMNSHDNWRNHRELLKSDDTTIVLDSDIQPYDPDNISAKPNESAKSDEPNNAQAKPNQIEPFKSAYGDTADLDNLRHLTVLFQPNNVSLPAAHSDDESYSDETYALAKSRGARKRVGYQHYERGQYEKQKQNSVSRKKRSKARKKKIDKAEYAAFKAQELRDLNKQLLKSHEHRDLKNYGESTPDSSQHIEMQETIKLTDQETKAELIEFFNRDNEDTSIDISHDEYNARSAVYRSLLERYKAATGKLPANYSFELCKRFDAFYPFWDNCGTMLDELHTMKNDANRSAFLESFRVAVAATRHDALSLSKLLKGFNSVRDFAKLPLSTGGDLGADQAPLDTDTAHALDRFPRNLRSANKADINFVLNDIHEHELEFKEDTTFKKFLAAFVVKLDQYMRLEEAEEQLHADKAKADHDFEAAYDLAKSRGTRKRTGYQLHERDQYRQKKQNSQAKKHAWQTRKEKKQYAELQADQLVDTKKNLLTANQYDTLKNETPDDDQVTDLAESLNSLSLGSDDDSTSSTSSSEDSDEWEVASDYKTCHNPECSDKTARICCKCTYGKRLRHAYEQLYGFNAFINDSDAPSDSDMDISGSSGLYFGTSYDGSTSDRDGSSNSSESYCGSSTSCGRDIVLDHATFAHMCGNDFEDLRAKNPASELIALDEITFLNMSLEDYRQAQKQADTRWVYSPESLTNFYFALDEEYKRTGFNIPSPEASSSGSSTPSDTKSDTRSVKESEEEAKSTTPDNNDNSFAPCMASKRFLTLFGKSLGNLTMEKLDNRFYAVLDTMDVCWGEEPATMNLDFDTREHLNNLSYNISHATDDEVNLLLCDVSQTLYGKKAPLFSTYLIEFARALDACVDDKQARTQEELIRRQEERDQVAAYHARHSNIPAEQDEDFDTAWHLSKSRGDHSKRAGNHKPIRSRQKEQSTVQESTRESQKQKMQPVQKQASKVVDIKELLKQRKNEEKSAQAMLVSDNNSSKDDDDNGDNAISSSSSDTNKESETTPEHIIARNRAIELTVLPNADCALL